MTTSTYHHAIPEGIDRSEVAIVGGGTAGLALASRLSESSDISILVLEAGVDRSSDQSVTTPSLNGKLQGNPEYHWDLQTLPQVGVMHWIIRRKFRQSIDKIRPRSAIAPSNIHAEKVLVEPACSIAT